MAGNLRKEQVQDWICCRRFFFVGFLQKWKKVGRHTGWSIPSEASRLASSNMQGFQEDLSTITQTFSKQTILQNWPMWSGKSLTNRVNTANRRPRGGERGELVWRKESSFLVKSPHGPPRVSNPVCLQKQLWRQGEETRLTQVSEFMDRSTNDTFQISDLQGARQSEPRRGCVLSGRVSAGWRSLTEALSLSFPRLLTQRRTAWGQVGCSSPLMPDSSHRLAGFFFSGGQGGFGGQC